jgi:hypothetical protein
VHVGAKGAVKVSGQLLYPEGHVPSTCWLELVRVEDGVVVKKREVRPRFDEVFLITPKRERYYFAARCGNFMNTTYKTSEFVLEGTKRYNSPIDLGDLQAVEEVPDRR